MWLHHAPYFMCATSSDSSQKSVRVYVDVFTLTESRQINGSVTLNRQKQLAVSTHYSRAPRILFFGKFGSADDALVHPHIFVYDDTLKQLKCHRIDPSGHSEIAQIDLELGRVACSTSVILASASSRRNQTRGYDLFEWTPYQHRLLQGHLETDHIVGFAESFHGQSWSIFYHHPTDLNRIVISRGSLLLGNSPDRGSLSPTMNTNAIAPGYTNNLQRIITSDRYFRASSNSTNDPLNSLWAQTRSGELVFFQCGILQWSTALPASQIEMTLVEYQAIDCVSKTCLLVQTEKVAYLYDAKLGRLVKDWTATKDNIILVDVQNVGLYSVWILSDHDQYLRSECTIHPTSALFVAGPSVNLTEKDISRAKANLNNALATLEQQLKLKRKTIERLQASLASKADIIQGCQELLNGPLCSILYAGHHLGTPNPTSHEEHASFQRKREQRRKKVLERLTPIIGNTVSTSFQSSIIDDSKVTMEPIERMDELAALECASGWIETTLGTTIWFGVHVWNHSTRTVYNIRLSVARQHSRGIVLSRMDSETGGVVLGLAQLDPLRLEDSEYLDKSSAATRVLSNTVRLHFDKRQIPGDDVNHVTLSIPRFPVAEHCALSWRSSLVDLFLPSRIGCRLDFIAGERISLLMKDGLGLSRNEDGVTFGSLEEGLIVTTQKTPQSTLLQELQNDSWDVVFKAQSESMAIQTARKAVALCRRFD